MDNGIFAVLWENLQETGLFLAYSAPTLLAVFALSLFFGVAFYALSAVAASGVWYAIAVSCGDYTTEACALIGVFLTELSILFCAVLFLVRAVRKKRERKRQALEERIRRESFFTLPDRENEFLRERLQTGLKIPDKVKEVEKTEFRLEYARTLLSRLKNTELTASDRLETESLSKLLTKYALDDSAQNTRSVGDCLMKILKLAAKYAVDCA